MIFEGLAKRILAALPPSSKNIPITKDDINANHQRYGAMIDSIHAQKKEKLKTFKDFRINKQPQSQN